MLEIPQWLLDDIHGHVKRDHPNEACGMVSRRKDMPVETTFGSPITRGGSTYRHTPMTNVDPNPRMAYAWSESEQLALWDTMDQEGTVPWVIYHSHTETAPEPSGIDRGAAWFPGVHYLIFSTAGGPEDVWYESWLCTEPGVLVCELVRVLA